MPNEIDEVLSAGAASPREPILDRTLSRSGPSHYNFDGLVGGTNFGFQRTSNGARISSKFVCPWKNYARFRQHADGPFTPDRSFAMQSEPERPSADRRRVR